jgi:hypothetical protein
VTQGVKVEGRFNAVVATDDEVADVDENVVVAFVVRKFLVLISVDSSDKQRSFSSLSF